MSITAPASQSGDGDPPRRGKATEVRVGLTLDPGQMEPLIGRLRDVVRQVVREEIAAATKLAEAPTKPAGDPKPVINQGIELLPDHKECARDLRNTLLLGKLPDDSGLLVDLETVAKLLNLSRRTLERLIAEEAIPQPVRFSGRLMRWRVAELLDWIEAGCPHTKHWTYEPQQRAASRRRK